MERTILGRTGLAVTVMGIGCGGPSRVGQRTGKSVTESVAVVRQALDAGVNLIDTAEGYQTEEIVGQAIRGRDRSEPGDIDQEKRRRRRHFSGRGAWFGRESEAPGHRLRGHLSSSRRRAGGL